MTYLRPPLTEERGLKTSLAQQLLAETEAQRAQSHWMERLGQFSDSVFRSEILGPTDLIPTLRCMSTMYSSLQEKILLLSLPMSQMTER